jgi:5'-nucleotidase
MAEHKVDTVIAMSHMRMPNDYRLAKECAGFIDIVLGGHDHHYEDTVINNIRILNSGTDFSDFSVVQIVGREEEVNVGDSPVILHPLKTVNKRMTVDPKSTEEDPEMVEALKEVQTQLSASMDKVIGTSKVDLDARFSEIRTKETNISNLVASVMTRATGADVAILNSGSLRADRIIPKGSITVRDLCDLLPMADPVAVIELSGNDLLKALENGELARNIQVSFDCRLHLIKSTFPILNLFSQECLSIRPWKDAFLALTESDFRLILPRLRESVSLKGLFL